MLANGATGIVVEHRDRILMWFGTEDRTVIPETI